MPAWTAPITWNVGQLVTAAELNTQLRDNLLVLKSPPSAVYTLAEAADYTTTSTTFVPIDATKLKHTLVTNGGNVLIVFYGTLQIHSEARWANFNIRLDGTTLIAPDDGVLGLTRSLSSPQSFYPFSIVYLLTGLAAGTHTFEMMWRVAATSATLTLFAGGSGTAGQKIHPQFWVREL